LSEEAETGLQDEAQDKTREMTEKQMDFSAFPSSFM